MGNIYIGLSKLKNCYIGTAKTKKIYLGETMIWQSAIPVAKPTELTPSGTYSGSVITNGYTCPSGVTLSGSASGTNAGTYTATYTPDEEHIWADTEDRTPVTVTLTINPMSISGATVTLSATSKTYNGSAQSVSISSVTINGLSATFTTSGTTSATDAGTYTVTATGSGNFTGTASATWTMNKATIDTLTLNTTSRTYNGSSQSVSVSTCKGNGVNATYSTSGTWSATNVGTYTATVTGTGNFQGSKSVSWTMNVLYLTIPTLSNTTRNYTGSSLAPTVSNYNSTYETQSGTASATSGGTYTITWSLKSTTNTKWSDNTTAAKSATWYIQYVWNKYNSVLTYAQASSTISAGSNIWYTTTSTYPQKAYQGRGTKDGSYTFSSSTGKYTISGMSMSTADRDSDYPYIQTTYYYYVGPPSLSSYSGAVDSMAKASGSGIYVYTPVNELSSSLRSYAKNGSVTKYTSSGTYSKGSTSYGTVTSTTSSSAYPSNGRNSSDGYWYVKTW